VEKVTIIKNDISLNVSLAIIKIIKYDDGNYPVFQATRAINNQINKTYNLSSEVLMSVTPKNSDNSIIKFHINGYNRDYFYDRVSMTFSTVQPIKRAL
jgi:hypothetical protein